MAASLLVSDVEQVVLFPATAHEVVCCVPSGNVVWVVDPVVVVVVWACAENAKSVHAKIALTIGRTNLTTWGADDYTAKPHYFLRFVQVPVTSESSRSCRPLTHLA
jgi:hypothetical protein